MEWIRGNTLRFVASEEDHDYAHDLYERGGWCFFKESDVVEVDVYPVKIRYTTIQTESVRAVNRYLNYDPFFIKLKDGTEYVCEQVTPLFESGNPYYLQEDTEGIED